MIDENTKNQLMEMAFLYGVRANNTRTWFSSTATGTAFEDHVDLMKYDGTEISIPIRIAFRLGLRQKFGVYGLELFSFGEREGCIDVSSKWNPEKVFDKITQFGNRIVKDSYDGVSVPT